MSDKVLIVVPAERDTERTLGLKDFYKDAVKNGASPVNDIQRPIDKTAEVGLLRTVDAVWYSTIYGVDNRMVEILTAANKMSVIVQCKWQLNVGKAFADAYDFACVHYKTKTQISDMDAYWENIVDDLSKAEFGGLPNPLRIKLIAGTINFFEAIIKEEIVLDERDVKKYIDLQFRKTLKGFKAHYYYNTKPSLDRIKNTKESLCDWLSEGVIRFLNDCEFNNDTMAANKNTA